MTQVTTSSQAQDLAGKAILFEIGAKAGIIDVLERTNDVCVDKLAEDLNISNDFIRHYFNVLESLQLVERNQENNFSQSGIYEQEKNKIGYISWGLGSCGPLLENTKAFTDDFDSAVRTHHRCGEHVARTSRWMGGKDFYPHAQNIILQLNPKKVVDLGSGTCGLLMRLARKIDGMTGVGVDLSKEACEIAKAELQKHGLSDRIEVVDAPIQSLIADNKVFENADVVHAGFVFHDLMPEEEETLIKLMETIVTTSPSVKLVIADAVPFAESEHERAFSSAFSFLHKFFMGRKLMPESEWRDKLGKAGYTRVDITPLGISGGRLIVASK